MKKARVTLSVILALVLALSAVIAVPVTASAESSEGFTLKLASNFFPEAERTYADISKFEDDNGDVYVTAMFKLYSDQKYIVNVDIDELTWDPDVLAWDESYNQDDVFGQLNLFPFAVESGSGAGIIHQTADGRIVGNYSNATQPAVAHSEDGTAVTVGLYQEIDRGENGILSLVIHRAIHQRHPYCRQHQKKIHHSQKNADFLFGA